MSSLSFGSFSELNTLVRIYLYILSFNTNDTFFTASDLKPTSLHCNFVDLELSLMVVYIGVFPHLLTCHIIFILCVHSTRVVTQRCILKFSGQYSQNKKFSYKISFLLKT